MKQLFTLVIAFISLSVNLDAQIISQYVETDSGTKPKGIEIWNNTGETLDFSTNNLVIKKGTNGKELKDDFTLSDGALAVGDVIVIGTKDDSNPAFDLKIVTENNGSVYHEYGFSFNGDDALEVWYGSNKTDIFGNPGSDPGTSWDGNSVSTRNQNIELLNGINTGASSAWTDPSARFETVSSAPASSGGIEGFGIAPSTSTSIEQSLLSKLIIYPNPFNTQLTLNGEEIASVEVLNSVGQLVVKVGGNSTSKVVVPTAELVKGIYVVKVTEANGNIITKKVIKK